MLVLGFDWKYGYIKEWIYDIERVGVYKEFVKLNLIKWKDRKVKRRNRSFIFDKEMVDLDINDDKIVVLEKVLLVNLKCFVIKILL